MDYVELLQILELEGRFQLVEGLTLLDSIFPMNHL